MRAREGGYRIHTIHANTSRADHAKMHSSLHTCPMPELHTCIRAKRDSRSWHRRSTARLWPLASSFHVCGHWPAVVGSNATLRSTYSRVLSVTVFVGGVSFFVSTRGAVNPVCHS